jgi:hypothetical protein
MRNIVYTCKQNQCTVFVEKGQGIAPRGAIRCDTIKSEEAEYCLVGGVVMNEANTEEKVLVQVVPVDEERQRIGWGESATEQLRNRLEDIRSAIAEGAKVVADSLEGLPGAKGWQLGEVSATFGVTLTAEAGVILSKASAGASFEVTVLFKRDQNQTVSN